MQDREYRYGPRRYRRLHQVNTNMRSRTERAVRVAVGPIGVDVSSLNGAGNNHQQHTQNREEEPPRICATALLVAQTH